MAVPFPDLLPDDCWSVILDAPPPGGLAPADLAALGRASKAGAALVSRLAPARLGVRAGCAAASAPLAWVLAPPRLSALVALALDLTGPLGRHPSTSSDSGEGGALASLAAALADPAATPRLADLTLIIGCGSGGSGDAAAARPPPVAAALILPRTGRLTRLALHGAPLDTAGLAGSALAARLAVLELDTAHAGPLWRPLYTLSIAPEAGEAGGPAAAASPLPLAALGLASAAPCLESLSIRVDSNFDLGAGVAVFPPVGVGDGGEEEEGEGGGGRPPLLASSTHLHALPACALTRLAILAAAPQAASLSAAITALVRSLPALKELSVTNRLGGVPALAAVAAAAGAREGVVSAQQRAAGARPPALSVRLAGSRSPFDPLSGGALTLPAPPPSCSGVPCPARLVALSLGSGRPMSAGGFGGGPGDTAGGGAAALDLSPLACPGAAPALADLELRDYGVIAGLPALAATGLTRLAVRVHRRFAREGAAMRLTWPVAAGATAASPSSSSSLPPPFARLRVLEVSLGEVHPDWQLVAWPGGGGAGGSGEDGGRAVQAAPGGRPGSSAHAALVRAAGAALGAALDAACFISAGDRATGSVDAFEGGVLASLTSRAPPSSLPPPRVVLIPDSSSSGGSAAPLTSPGTAAWAAPHPALRLAFTEAALLPAGLACAAPGMPDAVVAAVWGGRGGGSGGGDGGGGGGSQAAFHDLSAGGGT